MLGHGTFVCVNRISMNSLTDFAQTVTDWFKPRPYEPALTQVAPQQPQPKQENAPMSKRFLARQGDVMVREVNPATHTRLQEIWESGQAKIVERVVIRPVRKARTR